MVNKVENKLVFEKSYSFWGETNIIKVYGLSHNILGFIKYGYIGKIYYSHKWKDYYFKEGRLATRGSYNSLKQIITQIEELKKTE